MNEKTIKYWVELALEIATDAHLGQKRKNGCPYIEHPIRVASKVEDRLKPIALLHDVVEDTKITIDALKRAGFFPYVLDAVDILTHREGVPNIVYWNRILTNPDAVIVKLRDIEDNLSDTPSEYAKQKYAQALDLFRKAGVYV